MTLLPCLDVATAVVECCIYFAVFVNPVSVLNLLRLIELGLVMADVVNFQVLILAHVMGLLPSVVAVDRSSGSVGAGVELRRVGARGSLALRLRLAQRARGCVRRLLWPIKVLLLVSISVSGSLSVTAGACFIAST